MAKFKPTRIFINDSSGNTTVMVLIALTLVTIISSVIFERMLHGSKMDLIGQAELVENSILSDELKLMMVQGDCGIAKLNNGEPVSVTSGGSFPDNDAIFSLTGEGGTGLSDGSSSFIGGMTFDMLRIDSISVGPYDHRLDYLYSNPLDAEGFRLKNLFVDNTIEYVPINPEEYMGMLYVSSHPLALEIGGSNPSGTLMIAFPVVLRYQDPVGIISCRPAFNRQGLMSACAAMGGSWDEGIFRCSLKTGADSIGQSTTCPVDDRCNATDVYNL